MTGKSYYITTIADWQRHAARFAHSHYIVLDGFVGARHAVPGNLSRQDVGHPAPSPAETSAEFAQSCQASSPGPPRRTPTDETAAQFDAAAKILVLIEADEGVHLALEDDPAFEALPHPLAQKPISAAAQSALAPHGVAPGATTFDAAEALARLHPLLKHRIF